MKYKSGAAFRQALEQKLRDQSHSTGMPLSRLRKLIAFERFLARLVVGLPDPWVLKGGLALELRLRDYACTNQDIDFASKQLHDSHCSCSE